VIDRKWIGHAWPPSVLHIDRTRLQFFAKTIGETNPIYTDVAAARHAGYPDLPAPPTFIVAAEMDAGAVERFLAELAIPLSKLLHGEQGFTYHKTICAGDTIAVHSRITDIYDKKNGTLEFVAKTSRVFNQLEELVAELRAVIVCRHDRRT